MGVVYAVLLFMGGEYGRAATVLERSYARDFGPAADTAHCLLAAPIPAFKVQSSGRCKAGFDPGAEKAENANFIRMKTFSYHRFHTNVFVTPDLKVSKSHPSRISFFKVPVRPQVRSLFPSKACLNAGSLQDPGALRQ